MTRLISSMFAATLCLALLPALANADNPHGFVKVFNGKSLDGWILMDGAGAGYIVRNGILVCPADGGGYLMTNKSYGNFVFKCDFRLHHGGNNGVGIRAPLEGNPTYTGMEIQMLDDPDPMYRTIELWQHHGSVYNIVPAKQGSLKPTLEWNHEEITDIGRKIKVVVNGGTVVDTDLNDVHDAEIMANHPGMFRMHGHIGFLGHGPAEVEFKEVYIKELPEETKENTAPKGFVRLFDGKDLKGWKGLVSPDGGPPARYKMTRSQLAAAQVKADADMRAHWNAQDGVIHFDGHGQNLCTAKNYRDFEMWVDWKIPARGDSGIYIRGSPQVQIWDNPLGSGGLYNNQKGLSNPTRVEDKPIAEWNHFRIVMLGDKVSVWLNGVLVTHNIVMENYWERDKPIYRSEQIELQNHGGELWFKNIYIREIPGIP